MIATLAMSVDKLLHNLCHPLFGKRRSMDGLQGKSSPSQKGCDVDLLGKPPVQHFSDIALSIEAKTAAT